jgi:hypothetical protein
MPKPITAVLAALSESQQQRLCDALYMQHASLEMHQAFHNPAVTSQDDIQLEVAIGQHLADVYAERMLASNMHAVDAGPDCLQGWRREFVQAIGSARVGDLCCKSVSHALIDHCVLFLVELPFSKLACAMVRSREHSGCSFFAQ